MSDTPHPDDEQLAEINTAKQLDDATPTEGMRIEIEWCPASGPRRRLQFIPRADDSTWLRIESEWTGCRWRQTGQATVTGISVQVATNN